MEMYVVEADGEWYAFGVKALAQSVAGANRTQVRKATWIDELEGYAEVLALAA